MPNMKREREIERERLIEYLNKGNKHLNDFELHNLILEKTLPLPQKNTPANGGLYQTWKIEGELDNDLYHTTFYHYDND